MCDGCPVSGRQCVSTRQSGHNQYASGELHNERSMGLGLTGSELLLQGTKGSEFWGDMKGPTTNFGGIIVLHTAHLMSNAGQTLSSFDIYQQGNRSLLQWNKTLQQQI